METLMSVDSGLIIWSLINFTILMIILGKFAFPAIKNALKSREKNINKSIEEANALNEKAQLLLKESQEKLDNAQKEVSEIINNGKERADAHIQKSLEEADKLKNQKIEEAKREIERSKDEAIGQLRKEVADLVLIATEKVLDEKLDKDKHIDLIKNHIDQLPKN